jgi:ATP-dependent DNA helicase RecQ
MLLDYFGEQQTEDCGICDLCISNNTGTNEFRKTIREELLNSLKKNPIDISTFVAGYSKIKEHVILEEINGLLLEETLIKEGKTLKLNE